MRVITGKARGRKLRTLEGEDVRPTTEKVKEAIFSIIQFDIEGRRILDLFGGSGQMAIEALSRDAKEAVIVDSSKQSISIIKSNLETVGFSTLAKVVNQDALAFLAGCDRTFDIAFLDPPYRQKLIDRALPLLSDRMAAGSIIVCESAFEEELPQTAGAFSVDRVYRYSTIKVTVYRN